MSQYSTTPVTAGGRDFWLHYDHQVGRWCVENARPKVIRTGAEVIHTREVITSPAGDTVERAWRDLLEKDDRTSPAKYPDMALITFEEFRAVASTDKPRQVDPVYEQLESIIAGKDAIIADLQSALRRISPASLEAAVDAYREITGQTCSATGMKAALTAVHEIASTIIGDAKRPKDDPLLKLALEFMSGVNAKLRANEPSGHVMPDIPGSAWPAEDEVDW